MSFNADNKNDNSGVPPNWQLTSDSGEFPLPPHDPEQRRRDLFALLIGLVGILAAATVMIAIGGWPGAAAGSALGGTTILRMVAYFLHRRTSK